MEISPKTSVLIEQKGKVRKSERDRFMSELNTLDRIQKWSRKSTEGKSMKDIKIGKLLKSLKEETLFCEENSYFGAKNSSLVRESLVIERCNLDSFHGEITENQGDSVKLKSGGMVENPFGEPSSTRSNFSANFCSNQDKESKQ